MTKKIVKSVKRRRHTDEFKAEAVRLVRAWTRIYPAETLPWAE